MNYLDFIKIYKDSKIGKTYFVCSFAPNMNNIFKKISGNVPPVEVVLTKTVFSDLPALKTPRGKTVSYYNQNNNQYVYIFNTIKECEDFYNNEISKVQEDLLKKTKERIDYLEERKK